MIFIWHNSNFDGIYSAGKVTVTQMVEMRDRFAHSTLD
jgi:hypothetical protein